MPGDTSRRYPPELWERAGRMYGEVRPEHPTDWAAMGQVADLLGISTPETVRKWVRRAQVDDGVRPGVTSEESAEVKRLKREVAELVKPRAPWRTLDALEIATAEWVDWFNHRRLYEYCGDVPPADLEAAHYAHHQAQLTAEPSNQ